jgi:hypothetical protein
MRRRSRIRKGGITMKSFQAFDLYDYLILLGIMLVAIITYMLLLRRIKKNIKINKHFSPKNTIINIVIGSIVIIGSIIAYILIEKSHTGFMAFLSIAGCRPFVLLSIAGFLTGIIIIVLNSYKRKWGSKST